MLLDLLHHHHSDNFVSVSEGSNAPSRRTTASEHAQRAQKMRKLKLAAEYNQFKLRIQQDDQFATDFIVALVTKGFFNVC